MFKRYRITEPDADRDYFLVHYRCLWDVVFLGSWEYITSTSSLDAALDAIEKHKREHILAQIKPRRHYIK